MLVTIVMFHAISDIFIVCGKREIIKYVKLMGKGR